jgi:hypothetical protein
MQKPLRHFCESGLTALIGIVMQYLLKQHDSKEGTRTYPPLFYPTAPGNGRVKRAASSF